MTKVPIEVCKKNVLRWLGSLYRDAADAIKEHVSNAIDEHEKARACGRALKKYTVTFTLEKSRVTIEYPYGMSQDEFRDAMKRVADSAKQELDIRQIGRLGIGMFGFLQFGRKCTILSRKEKGGETFRAILRDGSDEAELETAHRRESLSEPGIKVVVSELKVDPTKPRGPLTLHRLNKLFGEVFAYHLKEGSLRIVLRCGREDLAVAPVRLDLPRIGESYSRCFVRGDPKRTFSLELYFDPAGSGRVSIRHTGVVVVEDIAGISAYGLEDGVLSRGDIKGFVDADFLTPLPARTGFEANDEWTEFLDELDKLCPSIQAEVDELKQRESQKQLTEIQRRAVELAKEILDIDELTDLEPLGGRGRKPPEPRKPPSGFDFVPASIRLDPKERRSIPLKATVPDPIPDGAKASLCVSEPLAVRLMTEEVCFKRAAENSDGVVTCNVELEGVAYTMAPAVLTARCESRAAHAYVRVAETLPRRKPESTEGPGLRFNFMETDFSTRGLSGALHSFFKGGTLEVNREHKHYVQARHGVEKLAYAALMIGKETIVLNYPAANDHLEKMLTFYFELRDRVTGKVASNVRRPRGRPRTGV